MRLAHLVLIALLLAGPGSFAQHYMSGAESVSFDTLNNRYLVSSFGNARIVAVDLHGRQSIFATGIGSPMGNEIRNDTLFVTAGTGPFTVIAFDLRTDELVWQIELTGAGRPDGIALDDGDNIYVVDVPGGKVYRVSIAEQTFEVFADEGITGLAQEIVFDRWNNRLLLVEYYGTTIKAISLEDGAVTPAAATELGYFDGICMDTDGRVYVATHRDNGAIYRYENDFSELPVLITQGYEQPAGIGINNRDSILAIPTFVGDSCEYVPLVLGISSDTTYGWAPIEVNFDGWCEYNVAEWSWDFGDGQTSDQQNPTHTYEIPGYYDVSLTVLTADRAETITRTMEGYVAALGDTIKAEVLECLPGTQVSFHISVRNNVPASKLIIPVEFKGDINPVLNGFSTDGLRGEVFEIQEYLHEDPYTRQYTIVLESKITAMPVGDGPVVALNFTLPGGEWWGNSNPVILDGYSSRQPAIYSYVRSFRPGTVDGLIHIPVCCDARGDVDNTTGPIGPVDVTDLTYLIDFLFASGPIPPCPPQANVDDIYGPAGPIDINDLNYLVEFLFSQGEAPPDCA